MELIKFNHTTKEERTQLVREIFDEVLNGRINPLELHLRLKSAEEVIKQLTGLEPYKAILLDEAQKHGKSFNYQAAKIDIREFVVKYDYSMSGSAELEELYKKQEAISERIKLLETYHKGLPAAGVQVLVHPHGELETHYPPAKTSTTSVAVTLK
ncbi:MAG: hypothetical protein IM551_00435 [Chitinophagaceae bacterium]|nr:hypothetical protein [Chitinophagaceae bacterium]